MGQLLDFSMENALLFGNSSVEFLGFLKIKSLNGRKLKSETFVFNSLLRNSGISASHSMLCCGILPDRRLLKLVGSLDNLPSLLLG